MTLTLDLSNDFLVFDNPETVVYQRRTGAASWDVGIPVRALKRASNKTEVDVSHGGEAITETTVFHLWACDMVSADPNGPDPLIPSRGDRLVEGQCMWLNETLDAGSTYWKVEDVDSQTFDTRYRLTCRKFVA